MSLKLPDPILGSDGVYNNLSFIKSDQSSYFSLKNPNGNEIRVSYIPIVDSSWDITKFEVFLLDNPYLNAENDVFEIYESTLPEERLGWTFPINVLVSNENDYSNYKNLNKYKYVAQYKLLNDHIRALQTSIIESDILITDIYSESSIVCILHKPTISKIPDFNINDYILSLYKYGYSFFQEGSIRKRILNKDEFISLMRQPSRKRINICKSEFNLKSNSYIESLFEKYLLKTDDFLVRFIFLYQVIEQLMEEEFSLIFQKYLNEYAQKKINKNDFKEYLNTASKERDLIKGVFNKTKIEADLIKEFDLTFDHLFEKLNYKIRIHTSDKIYDFRNLVTHSYRNVLNEVDIVNRIIQIFEDIIICTLINYNVSLAISPMPVVVN